jgi:hypothetical protein
MKSEAKTFSVNLDARNKYALQDKIQEENESVAADSEN